MPFFLEGLCYPLPPHGGLKTVPSSQVVIVRYWLACSDQVHTFNKKKSKKLPKYRKFYKIKHFLSIFFLKKKMSCTKNEHENAPRVNFIASRACLSVTIGQRHILLRSKQFQKFLSQY